MALNIKNRVIATGYNGLKSGQTLTQEEWADRDGRLKEILHAEFNALSLCQPGEVATLAATTLPCRDCARLIIDFGVKTVLYGQPYHRDSTSLKLFSAANVTVICIPIREVIRYIHGALFEYLIDASIPA